jgi:ethanolamine ammonia-lyase large subunit
MDANIKPHFVNEGKAFTMVGDACYKAHVSDQMDDLEECGIQLVMYSFILRE